MSHQSRWKYFNKRLIFAVVFFLLAGVSPWSVAAVEPEAHINEGNLVTLLTGEVDGPAGDADLVRMPEESAHKSEIPQAPAIGGVSPADDYGYTWDDTVPLSWVNATDGSNTGMQGPSNGQSFGPVEMGFSFHYYEHTYSQVYIAASGFITFTDVGSWPNQSQIPSVSEPNNVIAPYWAPLYLAGAEVGGQVYYRQGGEAPERYFVVEWYRVAGGPPEDPTGGDDVFHFQVILYESGDIRFQYLQMDYIGGSYCGAAGIENASGEDGLTYLPFCAAAEPGRAVLFARPEPAARVRVSPVYQSAFIQPGQAVLFPLTFTNLGDLGDDTYALTANADWPLTFLDDDGQTELVDTTDDGQVDTGSIAPLGTRQVLVKISAPAGVTIGAGDRPTITVSSALDPTRSQAVTLHAAVSARFTQIYRDDAQGGMSLMFAGPQENQVHQATSDAWWGYNPAVTETSSGRYVYVWQRYRYRNGGGLTAELEVAVLNHAGDVIHPTVRLTDHSLAEADIYDEEPVLAAAPDGTLAVAWRRRVVRQGLGGAEENWNVFMSALNEDGSLQSSPVNLTQNTSWYNASGNNYGVPRYWNARLAASPEGNFALTWRRESQEAPSGTCVSNCILDDVYFAIWADSGEMIKLPSRLTTDTPSATEGYFSPTVQSLSGGRWLFIYNHNPGGLGMMVLDEQGEVLRGQSYIGKFGWSPVAQEIPGQNVVIIAWTAWTSNNPQIHTLAINTTTYQRISSPLVLTNPAATSGGDYSSLTVDAHGRAILTWMDFSANNRRHLYYALLDANGALVTPPMVFQQAEASLNNGRPHIETSFSGYSNTSKRPFLDLALTDWSAGWVERLYDSGITAGCQVNPPLYCPVDFVRRSEMAVFLERGMRGADYQPPAASGMVFNDVSTETFAASWIELLYADGITEGCGGGNYCPDQAVTRAEMAIFLLRAKHYPESYTPPPVGETTGFADVAPDDFAAAWIKQLAAEGITSGCGGGNFCPESAVTREQMAVFLVRAFNLP